MPPLAMRSLAYFLLTKTFMTIPMIMPTPTPLQKEPSSASSFAEKEKGPT